MRGIKLDQAKEAAQRGKLLKAAVSMAAKALEGDPPAALVNSLVEMATSMTGGDSAVRDRNTNAAIFIGVGNFP